MPRQILLYTFHFIGYDRQGKKVALPPMKIEAPNQSEARWVLQQLVMRNPDYAGSKVVDEFVESPVTNVTTKVHNGTKYIYVGFDNSETGWLPFNPPLLT